ncbi:hypothetical protein [Frigoribacterium sp. CG_9.8]|uniref:hypothetical protein n=1 Tax=Frigoribacterium sp. CG_9.8 TaxID=2787733 RepID=UPI0018C991C4|nr:hypothetical protein [Frigoribacterium sp. CG_9.8]MBG6106608.1 hypothetical protein [Frigoribacterium sp. CG_9.8]
MTTATVTTLARTQPKSRGRTQVERLKNTIEIENIERLRKEGANRAPRFSAQHKFVLILLLSLALFMAAASFITSFNGLFGAAAWAIGDKTPWLQVAAPVMFDVAIIAFTLKLFMDREEGVSIRSNWAWIGVLAAVSATANVFHTLTVTTATTLPQLVMGCVISGCSPFLLALVIDVAASKVFKRPEAAK